MTGPAIQRALPADLREIESLLTSSGLPVEGASAHLDHFLVARDDGSIAGVIGIELYGGEALLRSLAVRESHRSKGVGSALYLRLIEEARSAGVRRVVLLTTTAERYFSARGFKSIPRDTITGALAHSAEFTGACPDSAACMELVL